MAKEDDQSFGSLFMFDAAQRKGKPSPKKEGFSVSDFPTASKSKPAAKASKSSGGSGLDEKGKQLAVTADQLAQGLSGSSLGKMAKAAPKPKAPSSGEVIAVTPKRGEMPQQYRSRVKISSESEPEKKVTQFIKGSASGVKQTAVGAGNAAFDFAKLMALGPNSGVNPLALVEKSSGIATDLTVPYKQQIATGLDAGVNRGAKAVLPAVGASFKQGFEDDPIGMTLQGAGLLAAGGALAMRSPRFRGGVLNAAAKAGDFVRAPGDALWAAKQRAAGVSRSVDYSAPTIETPAGGWGDYSQPAGGRAPGPTQQIPGRPLQIPGTKNFMPRSNPLPVATFPDNAQYNYSRDASGRLMVTSPDGAVSDVAGSGKKSAKWNAIDQFYEEKATKEGKDPGHPEAPHAYAGKPGVVNLATQTPHPSGNGRFVEASPPKHFSYEPQVSPRSALSISLGIAKNNAVGWERDMFNELGRNFLMPEARLDWIKRHPEVARTLASDGVSQHNVPIARSASDVGIRDAYHDLSGWDRAGVGTPAEIVPGQALDDGQGGPLYSYGSAAQARPGMTPQPGFLTQASDPTMLSGDMTRVNRVATGFGSRSPDPDVTSLLSLGSGEMSTSNYNTTLHALSALEQIRDTNPAKWADIEPHLRAAIGDTEKSLNAKSKYVHNKTNPLDENGLSTYEDKPYLGSNRPGSDDDIIEWLKNHLKSYPTEKVTKKGVVVVQRPAIFNDRSTYWDNAFAGKYKKLGVPSVKELAASVTEPFTAGLPNAGWTVGTNTVFSGQQPTPYNGSPYNDHLTYEAYLRGPERAKILQRNWIGSTLSKGIYKDPTSHGATRSAIHLSPEYLDGLLNDRNIPTFFGGWNPDGSVSTRSGTGVPGDVAVGHVQGDGFAGSAQRNGSRPAPGDPRGLAYSGSDNGAYSAGLRGFGGNPGDAGVPGGAVQTSQRGTTHFRPAPTGIPSVSNPGLADSPAPGTTATFPDNAQYAYGRDSSGRMTVTTPQGEVTDVAGRGDYAATPSDPNYVGEESRKAQEILGTTRNPDVAGFITRDGKMLTLSESGDWRDLEHYYIEDRGLSVSKLVDEGVVRWTTPENPFGADAHMVQFDGRLSPLQIKTIKTHLPYEGQVGINDKWYDAGDEKKIDAALRKSNDVAGATQQSIIPTKRVDATTATFPDNASYQYITGIDFTEYPHYGIRSVDEDYQIGDTIPDSRVWDDGEPTDEALPGASSTEIRNGDVKKSWAIHKREGYPPAFKKTYVIAGNNMTYGEDAGESIIENPRVVGIVDRDTGEAHGRMQVASPDGSVGDVAGDGAKKEPWQMTRGEYLGEGIKAYKGMPVNDFGTGEPILDIDAKKQGKLLAGYFSDSKDVADRFTKSFKFVFKNNDSRTLESSLTFKNPFVIDAGGKPARDFMTDSLEGKRDHAEIVSAIKSGKYDGLIVKNTSDEGTIYAPLESSQIRTDFQHQKSVEKALAEGKPVPPEVLADYPDLATNQVTSPDGSVGDVAGDGAPEGVAPHSKEASKQWQDQFPLDVPDRDELVRNIRMRDNPPFWAVQLPEGKIPDEARFLPEPYQKFATRLKIGNKSDLIASDPRLSENDRKSNGAASGGVAGSKTLFGTSVFSDKTKNLKWTIAHEVAHDLYDYLPQGLVDKWSALSMADKNPLDYFTNTPEKEWPVTHYGQTSSKEDFAESFAFHILGMDGATAENIHPSAVWDGGLRQSFFREVDEWTGADATGAAKPTTTPAPRRGATLFSLIPPNSKGVNDAIGHLQETISAGLSKADTAMMPFRSPLSLRDTATGKTLRVGTYERLGGDAGAQVSDALRAMQTDEAGGMSRAEVLQKYAPDIEQLAADIREGRGTKNGVKLPGLAEEIQKHVQDLMGAPKPYEQSAGRIINGLTRQSKLDPDLAADAYLATRAIAGKITGLHSIIKLRHSPRSAAVNLVQPLETLWPYVTTAEYGSLVKEAMKPSTWDRLEYLGVLEGPTKMEGVEPTKTTGSRFKDAVKNPFGTASSANRIMGYLYGESAAKKAGITDPAKIHENGIVWAEMVEFDNSIYNSPPILRDTAAKVALQFKGFTVKSLENILADGGILRGDVGGMPLPQRVGRVGKFAAAKLATGGLKSLSLGTALGATAYLALREALEEKGMDEETANTWATSVLLGAPSLLGVDISSSVGVLDPPFGETMEEQVFNFATGPTGGAVKSAIKLGQEFPSDPIQSSWDFLRSGSTLPKNIEGAVALGGSLMGRPQTFWDGKKEVPMTRGESVAKTLGFALARSGTGYAQKDVVAELANQWADLKYKKWLREASPDDLRKSGLKKSQFQRDSKKLNNPQAIRESIAEMQAEKGAMMRFRLPRQVDLPQVDTTGGE